MLNRHQVQAGAPGFDGPGYTRNADLPAARVDSEPAAAPVAAFGVTFVRRCCIFYICALVGFWIVGTTSIYLRTLVTHDPFKLSLSSIMFKQKTYSFTDFLDFDPVTERVISRGELNKDYDLLIVYPAPMMGAYIVFTRAFREPLLAYLLFVAGCLAAGVVLLIASLWPQAPVRWYMAVAVLLSAILSYPVYFLLERANMDGVVWIVIAIALTAFAGHHNKTAAIFFGLAASMKMYPGLLFLLFVARKRYRDFGLAIVAAGAFTLLGLALIGPSIPAAYQEVRAGIAKLSLSHFVSFRYNEIGYDHSLFSVVKEFLYFPHRYDLVEGTLNREVRAAATPYFVVVILGFIAAYWFRIRKMPVLNQVIALLIMAVTLPYLSYEYTLNHMYCAWAFFLLFLARDVATGRETMPRYAALAILACFAFIFAPGPMHHYAGQLKACALMALFALALSVPMRSSLLESAD